MCALQLTQAIAHSVRHRKPKLSSQHVPQQTEEINKSMHYSKHTKFARCAQLRSQKSPPSCVATNPCNHLHHAPLGSWRCSGFNEVGDMQELQPNDALQVLFRQQKEETSFQI
ncbi:hypothetical protein VNO78_33079 [Psophocarpus tetragonolobus]|uniref:Uncharacterized protein n=1 Tax=Psophocarpus tetragonolobus TaxID=3891 RepID=A0AAN9NWA7_PSOTE